MTKKSKIIYIIGSVVIGIAALLVVFCALIASGVIDVKQKNITFTSASAQYTYDGTAHSDDGWEITYGQLKSGHKASVTVYGVQTDAGESPNYLAVTIYDEDGADVTENYEVTYDLGTLTVLKKDITITSLSATKEYDGTPLSFNSFKTFGNVCDGQTLNVEVSGEITNVGSTTNTLHATVTDKSGADKTNNYNLIFDEGTLEVTKRQITVSSSSGEKVYDGQKFINEEWKIIEGSLVEGHKTQVIFADNALNAGENENEFSLTICSSDGQSVTDNYQITYEYGILNITKAPFYVYTGSSRKFYDKTPLTNLSYEYSEGLLVSGQTAQLTVIGSQTKIGISTNDYILRITDENGYDTTGNYQITENLGTLEVYGYTFNLTTGSAEKYYDGTPVTNSWYEVTQTQLQEGHQYTVNVTGSRIDAGTSPNTAVVKVTDQNGQDVTDYYDVQVNEGTLSVVKLALTISTPSARKVYDGTPLYNYSYTIDGGELLQGDEITQVVMNCSCTDVGSVKNEIAYIEIMRGDTVVTNNYDINYLYGTLSVTSRNITVRSGTKSKDYDGTPLTCGEWEIVSLTQPVATHTVSVAISGYILEVGERDNTIAEVLITDENGNDVTNNYNITLDEGVLTIKGTTASGGNSAGSSGESGGGGSGGSGGFSDLDLSGNIAGGESGEGNASSLSMNIYSTQSQSVYLRIMSYGDYTGKGWDSAREYTSLLDGTYSLNYLTSATLKNAGYSSSLMKIQVAGSGYYLPYYLDFSSGDYTVQTSDVKYTGSESEYNLYYYYYNVVDGQISANVGSYTQAEANYRQFVYSNYLNVPSSTANYLKTIIAEQNFAKSNNVIAAVASYVQNAATYNLKYDSGLNSEEDMVVAFLSIYKEGVCRHYASTATLLFRQLGYPARYVVGYHAETKENEWVTVTSDDAHAWVEVYLDGLGWVYVDVTGGTSGGQNTGGSGGSGEVGGGGDKSDDDKNYAYVFKPTDEYMLYTDGLSTLTHSQTLQGFSALASKGYYYDVTISGSRKEPGITESKITSLTIYDSDGNDVTDTIDFVLKTGKLQVYLAELNITTQGLTKVYDGTAATNNGVTISGSLIDGDSILYCNTVGSIINVGTVVNKIDIKIVDSQGNDVTDIYKINGDYGTLEVVPREITITSKSASKKYTGSSLTCDDYDMTGTLAAGQSIYVNISGEQVYIGRSENTITSVYILDENGDDVTANYNITKQNGTLTVTKN